MACRLSVSKKSFRPAEQVFKTFDLKRAGQPSWFSRTHSFLPLREIYCFLTVSDGRLYWPAAFMGKPRRKVWDADDSAGPFHGKNQIRISSYSRLPRPIFSPWARQDSQSVSGWAALKWSAQSQVSLSKRTEFGIFGWASTASAQA